eukprot:5172449-Pyramimonas_sp.AAC.1
MHEGPLCRSQDPYQTDLGIPPRLDLQKVRWRIFLILPRRTRGEGPCTPGVAIDTGAGTEQEDGV